MQKQPQVPIYKDNTNSWFERNVHYMPVLYYLGLPWWLSGQESACSAGGANSDPGWRRFPGEGNGNSLQQSCLENPMDRRASCTTFHESQSQT